MKCKVINVIVNRSIMCKIGTTVCPHEIPVLMVKYDQTSIVFDVNDVVAEVERDEAEEYERLVRKYGQKDVSAVYGSDFERRLEGAMAQGLDLLRPRQPAPATPPPPPPQQDPLQSPPEKVNEPDITEDPLRT